MTLILDIPLTVRLLAIFLAGTCIGGLANLAVYTLAWHPRPISPWGAPDPAAPPRRWHDRLPITGWLGLRREAGLHGTAFWVRPMLLELLTGIAIAALYWWETARWGLLPGDAPHFARLGDHGIQAILHMQFLAHLLLVTLMLVASMIDADEKTIPDAITVPGTLLGLLLATVYPCSLLPDLLGPVADRLRPNFWGGLTAENWQILQVTSPLLPPPGPAKVVPQGIPAFAQLQFLAAGLACWWLWCVALTPRTWYSRHGWRRAMQLCVARLLRESVTYWILVMGLVGSTALAIVWAVGEPAWTGLLTALVGMAGGGGLIWIVRVVGTAALRREAMGFGDVTLMAMIGAFLGWQTCLVVFFVAPFAALVIGALQLILLRDSEIPYGPFLCLATVGVIVRWDAVWSWAGPMFSLGGLVLLIVLCCMILLAAMLWAWRIFLTVFRTLLRRAR